MDAQLHPLTFIMCEGPFHIVFKIHTNVLLYNITLVGPRITAPHHIF